MLETRGAI